MSYVPLIIFSVNPINVSPWFGTFLFWSTPEWSTRDLYPVPVRKYNIQCQWSKNYHFSKKVLQEQLYKYFYIGEA